MGEIMPPDNPAETFIDTDKSLKNYKKGQDVAVGMMNEEGKRIYDPLKWKFVEVVGGSKGGKGEKMVIVENEGGEQMRIGADIFMAMQKEKPVEKGLVEESTKKTESLAETMPPGSPAETLIIKNHYYILSLDPNKKLINRNVIEAYNKTYDELMADENISEEDKIKLANDLLEAKEALKDPKKRKQYESLLKKPDKNIVGDNVPSENEEAITSDKASEKTAPKEELTRDALSIFDMLNISPGDVKKIPDAVNDAYNYLKRRERNEQEERNFEIIKSAHRRIFGDKEHQKTNKEIKKAVSEIIKIKEAADKAEKAKKKKRVRPKKEKPEKQEIKKEKPSTPEKNQLEEQKKKDEEELKRAREALDEEMAKKEASEKEKVPERKNLSERLNELFGKEDKKDFENLTRQLAGERVYHFINVKKSDGSIEKKKQYLTLNNIRRDEEGGWKCDVVFYNEDGKVSREKKDHDLSSQKYREFKKIKEEERPKEKENIFYRGSKKGEIGKVEVLKSDEKGYTLKNQKGREIPFAKEHLLKYENEGKVLYAKRQPTRSEAAGQFKIQEINQKQAEIKKLENELAKSDYMVKYFGNEGLKRLPKILAGGFAYVFTLGKVETKVIKDMDSAEEEYDKKAERIRLLEEGLNSLQSGATRAAKQEEEPKTGNLFTKIGSAFKNTAKEYHRQQMVRAGRMVDESKKSSIEPSETKTESKNEVKEEVNSEPVEQILQKYFKERTSRELSKDLPENPWVQSQIGKPFNQEHHKEFEKIAGLEEYSSSKKELDDYNKENPENHKYDFQEFNDDGWKLHLNVEPENVKKVSEYLTKNGYMHKFLSGGDLGDGKVFTIYIGSYNLTDKLSQEISEDLTGLLAKPAISEVEFAPGVVGRFTGDRFNFTQYSLSGIGFSFLEKDAFNILGIDAHIRLAKSEEEKEKALAKKAQYMFAAEKNAYEALRKKYGDYFFSIEPKISKEKPIKAISGANSLDELYEILREKGGIQGSEESGVGEVNTENLIKKIKDLEKITEQAILEGKVDIVKNLIHGPSMQVFTRTEGLRDKIIELFEKFIEQGSKYPPVSVDELLEKSRKKE